MNNFWNGFIYPLLKEISPKHLVEISYDDKTCLDKFSIFSDTFNTSITIINRSLDYHQYQSGTIEILNSSSINVLFEINNFEAVMLHAEDSRSNNDPLIVLKTIERKFHEFFPLVFIHGIDTNRVLNSIESFLHESSIPLNFFDIPGLGGLGIIVSQEILQKHPDINNFLNNKISKEMKAHVMLIEKINRAECLEKQRNDSSKLKEDNNFSLNETSTDSFKKMLLYSIISIFQRPLKITISNLLAYKRLKQHGLFERRYYLNFNKDVESFKWGPLVHYLYFGGFEGRNPSKSFDNLIYVTLNPHVRKLKINPLVHYELYGKRSRGLYQSDINKNITEIAVDYSNVILDDSDTVSIVMPTWNRELVIGRAIDSILKQTFTNFELIIIDDGSTDGTENYIETHFREAIDNGLIKYIKQSNQGVSNARNKGLGESTGKYIAYLDSDNTWELSYLEKMVKSLKASNKKAAYSAIRVNDLVRGRQFVRNKAYDRKELLIRNFIDLNIFMHTRDLYENLGGFNESLKRLVDWDFILRLTKDNTPIFLNEVLANYYLSEELNNITNTVSLDFYVSKIKEIHKMELTKYGLIFEED